MDVQPTNLQQMRDAIMSIWTKISEECLLVESMPRRIKAILKSKGGPTRYYQGVPNKVASECRSNIQFLSNLFTYCVQLTSTSNLFLAKMLKLSPKEEEKQKVFVNETRMVVQLSLRTRSVNYKYFCKQAGLKCRSFSHSQDLLKTCCNNCQIEYT